MSCLYLGNLVFRLMHNIVFACLIPRHRVFVSFILMACSMSILGVFVFLLEIKQMAIVFAAYFMGGVSIGTFESNLLSSISPLGHATKTWAVIGIPVGYVLQCDGVWAAAGSSTCWRQVQLDQHWRLCCLCTRPEQPVPPVLHLLRGVRVRGPGRPAVPLRNPSTQRQAERRVREKHEGGVHVGTEDQV